jgi:transcriptional regulator with XRE-family HTH domain
MAEPPIGVRLRTALEEKGWSYTRLIAEMRKVASRQGKTLPTTASLIAMLSRWLNGHERPSRFYREILSGALGLDQAELESGNGHELRGHPRLRRRDRRLPPGAGLVGAAAGRQLHHRRQPRHPLALPARRRLAGPLVRLDPGRLRHRRVARPQRGPRPRPHQRAVVRRAATGRAAGGAGAADERGPHRPAAHQPHPESTRATRHRGQGHRRPHTQRQRPPAPGRTHPAVLQDRTGQADQDTTPAPDARSQVRALVARERAGGPAVTAADVIAATGRSRRRAYKLLRDARAEEGTCSPRLRCLDYDPQPIQARLFSHALGENDLGPCVDCQGEATKLLVGGGGQPDLALCERCEKRRYLQPTGGGDLERARWGLPPCPDPS